MNKVRKAKQLSEVKVKFISILTDEVKPSNGAGVVIKSDNGFSLDCNIKKFDELKGLLYVEPMIALKADSDNEYYENEDVVKAAHEFMKGGIENPSDINHNFTPAEGVKVVESYVDDTEDAYIWKSVLDISENEELMTKAKSNSITGVSIGGTAEVSKIDNPEITKAESNNSLLDMLKNAFKEKMNGAYCWLQDLLIDGTAIFEVEYETEDSYDWKYYKQAYTITDGKVALIGEAKEVVRVDTYVEKARREINKKKGNTVEAVVKEEKLEEIFKTVIKKFKQEITLKEKQLEEPIKKESVEEDKKISLFKKTEVN